MSIICDNRENDDVDTDDQTPPVPSDQAVLDFAWAVAQASDRDEWTNDLGPLSPLSLRFDELRDYVYAVEWQGSEVFIYASKPLGEGPHPRHAIDVDLWLTFDGVPRTQVRVTVMR